MFIDSQCWIAVTFWFATCKPPRYLNPRVLSQGFLLGKDSSGFVQGLCKGGPHVLGRCQRWGSLRDPLRQHVHATSLGEFCLAILRLHPKDPCFDHMLCFCHALDSAASVFGLAGRDKICPCLRQIVYNLASTALHTFTGGGTGQTPYVRTDTQRCPLGALLFRGCASRTLVSWVFRCFVDQECVPRNPVNPPSPHPFIYRTCTKPG